VPVSTGTKLSAGTSFHPVGWIFSIFLLDFLAFLSDATERFLYSVV